MCNCVEQKHRHERRGEDLELKNKKYLFVFRVLYIEKI